MSGRGREEALEFGDDEACVEVDVPADGEERDAPVFDAEEGDVWSGDDWGLDLVGFSSGTVGKEFGERRLSHLHTEDRVCGGGGGTRLLASRRARMDSDTARGGDSNL